MRSRPLLSWLLLAWLLVLLAGCASGPGSYEVSRRQLETALERRFPYEARRAGLFIVNVGVPRLQLLPEANRVRLDFPLEASERIARSTTRGELGVSFAIRYEPADASLRAVNVRVENLALQGFASEWRAPLEAAGGLIAENLLEGTVLHSFRPEELARANGRTPGAIRVTPTGVRIELLPPPG
jgi:hypothetical protein